MWLICLLGCIIIVLEVLVKAAVGNYLRTSVHALRVCFALEANPFFKLFGYENSFNAKLHIVLYCGTIYDIT